MRRIDGTRYPEAAEKLWKADSSGLKSLGMTRGREAYRHPSASLRAGSKSCPSRKLRGLKAAQDDSLHDSLQDMTRIDGTRYPEATEKL
ncbi:MAG: hypothetical protein DMG72_22745 [Acidobacteria bacterium]|nr:MAG: hypothetical protein DMG72_22745 [Acidobacteriota bacterium]